jgi:threonylcarbamoyladenosine tRNA methylthiotransferase MtaB
LTGNHGKGVAAIRFCFETLGCKVNQFETQALETLLAARGHERAAPGSGCDAVVVNTCAVTAESARKSRQAVRRLRKLEPDAAVAVCGCFSQVHPDVVEALGVDLLSGSGDRLKFIDELERICAERAEERKKDKLPPGSADRLEFIDELERVTADKSPRRLLDEPKDRRAFEVLPTGSAAGRTRAMLKIQDGCQNFCAYCIIPHARGPVRSLPLRSAAAEAERLNAQGYKEIVVTGIEISSYGMDLPGRPALPDAVAAVSRAAPDARLRLGSLEPPVVKEDFCAALRQLPNICDHFHLSLQSGCDATLRRMRRRYSTDTFYHAVTLLKTYFPDCAVTADLIVGFPGETDEEFNATLAFIRKCAFSSMHVFPFSRRPGTPAADMPDQVARSIRLDRARRAGETAGEMALDYAGSCVGKTLDVLFEREKQGVCDGHAGNYMRVSVRQAGLKGRLCPVRITGSADRLLSGDLVSHDLT